MRDSCRSWKKLAGLVAEWVVAKEKSPINDSYRNIIVNYNYNLDEQVALLSLIESLKTHSATN